MNITLLETNISPYCTKALLSGWFSFFPQVVYVLVPWRVIFMNRVSQHRRGWDMLESFRLGIPSWFFSLQSQRQTDKNKILALSPQNCSSFSYQIHDESCKTVWKLVVPLDPTKTTYWLPSHRLRDVLMLIDVASDFLETLMKGLTMRANQVLKLDISFLRLERRNDIVIRQTELAEVRSTLGNDDGDHQAAAVWHAGPTFGWLRTFEVEVFNAG